MDLKTMNTLSRIFAITALVAAFYNAYLTWVKDGFSPLLLWTTLILVFLSSIIREFVKRKS
ncbi:hypothetical protein LI82_02880 [Methanococcoides methylutens]|uniref:Uncharacterized protein n=1 Tax=Methanococcoides methylutens TaxID=2226 RepID=A0A099T448_METMT|nr:hypothetical protein [Methanococcoides methylutens]KGK98996.1 hypothetical protein LI82_02880 [Methanococcoides methylutens]